MGLVIGIVAAMVLGAGGFFAAYTGMIGGISAPDTTQIDQNSSTVPSIKGIAFIPLDPLVVSLGFGATNRHLRFGAQLEVSAEHLEEVTLLSPRVLNVLNGYLRAVEARDIENPSSMGRLRAQMLRRVQVVTGEGRVRDLLITEFVLN